MRPGGVSGGALRALEGSRTPHRRGKGSGCTRSGDEVSRQEDGLGDAACVWVAWGAAGGSLPHAGAEDAARGPECDPVRAAQRGAASAEDAPGAGSCLFGALVFRLEERHCASRASSRDSVSCRRTYVAARRGLAALRVARSVGCAWRSARLSLGGPTLSGLVGTFEALGRRPQMSSPSLALVLCSWIDRSHASWIGLIAFSSSHVTRSRRASGAISWPISYSR